MEVEPILGNDEPVLIIDTYFVINEGMTWKSDRRAHLSLRLEGAGDHTYAYNPDGDNLLRFFKEGDKIVFPQLATSKDQKK